MQACAPSEHAIRIQIGSAPPHLDAPTGKGILFESTRDEFLLKFKNIASFYVERGARITVDPSPGASAKDIRLFLLGSAMAGLLHQRELIPLHGSCAHSGSGALVFSGPSSSGKSSLAAGLAQMGHSILADDITAIEHIANGSTQVFPGLTRLKIWKDVARYFRLEHQLERVRDELDKYYLPIEREASIRSLPLDKIILLYPSNLPDFKLKEIHGAGKFELVYRNIYRINFPVSMSRSQELFDRLSQVLNKVPVYSLIRPSKPIAIRELSEFVSKEFLQ